MTEQLKPLPCPFCGRTDIRAHVYGGGEPDAFMQCHDCSADGPNGLNRAGAIEAWNRRAQPAQADADGLVFRETTRGKDYIRFEATYTGKPAQAGQVLSDAEIDALYAKSDFDADPGSDYGCGFYSGARWAEQAVLAKRVPMTQAEMLAAFAVAHPQDHADMQDGSPANAIERIGARAVYRRFERGIRAAEKFHGIVGEKGGA